MKKLMRFYFIALLLCLINLLHAQMGTIEWIVLDEGVMNEACTSNTNCTAEVVCLGLQYSPNTTGTISSYTSGFLINCLNNVNPISSNESCAMMDNSSFTDACADFNAVLFNSSADFGSIPCTEGEAMILHQVCFNISPTESITIDKGTVSNISISIDVPGQGVIQDNPTYNMNMSFTLNGLDVCASALSTNFLSFDATLNDDQQVLLDWHTSKSIHSDFFEVEHSIDNLHFSTIGKVNSGNDTDQKRYQYTDVKPIMGDNYYRIKQVYMDGRFETSPSKIIHLKNTAETLDVQYLSVYPTPVTDVVQVDISQSRSKDLVLDLYNATGEHLTTGVLKAGESSMAFDVYNYPAGVYFITYLNNDLQHKTKEFIVVRN